MAEPTTLTPNHIASTDDLVVGRGRVWLSEDTATGADAMGAFRYIGNTTAFSLNVSTESLPHFSMDDDIARKDKEVITQYNERLTMTCDYINSDNLAMFLLGLNSVCTTTAATGQMQDIIGARLGGGYLLGATAVNPTGAGIVENVAVTIASDETITLVDGTDYVVDYNRGFITILGGKIGDGMTLKVAYDIVGSTRNQVISKNNQRTGQLFYEARNPVGPQNDFWFPEVSINPDGDYALKGDGWQNMSFTIDILKPKNTLLASMYSANLPQRVTS